jgi:hypothetical protein
LKVIIFFKLKTKKAIMSKENRTLASLNWLCWLQDADYDVWLILLEYLKPIIDMRITHKEIRYFENPIFKKVAKRMHNEGTFVGWTRDAPIYSVAYLRWYHGHFNVQCPYQTGEVFRGSWGDVDIYGLRWHSSVSSYQTNTIRETKDEVIEVMKFNKIPYKKSWTKQKLMKTIMKHAIVD